MSEDKYTRIEGPSGEKLIVVPKVRLMDQLPSPKDIAKEMTGEDDCKVNAAWLYAENGKAPR